MGFRRSVTVHEDLFTRARQQQRRGARKFMNLLSNVTTAGKSRMTTVPQPLTLCCLILVLSQSLQDSRSSALNLSTGIGQSRSGYSDSHHHHHGTPHHVISLHGHGGGHGGHGHSFFDIALTGLAFLSFGIFLLNLLLNALLGAGMATGTVLPTNTGTGIITNTAVTVTGGRSGHRGRRDVPFELHLDPVTSMEALAASVLKSIDAMVNEHECLQKVFCDGSKEAKVIGSGFQYMMPAYSLGASYIGRRIGFHDSFSDHLKAVVLGFGESNCKAHFPQC